LIYYLPSIRIASSFAQKKNIIDALDKKTLCRHIIAQGGDYDLALNGIQESRKGSTPSVKYNKS
jgi:hypothetical protein